MNIISEIKSAERIHKRNLEDFFNESWGRTTLSSHGLDHHRRVWNYARELLIEIASAHKKSVNIPVEKLIIGCYLHDLGMLFEQGEKHGLISSQFCIRFLDKYGMDISKSSDLIEAIRLHDEKEKRNLSGNFDLASLLSAADDLDAFGYIGVYRYLEIYLLRGIPPEELGNKAKGNALARFLNFQDLFNNYPNLVNQHKKRYNCLDNFFSDYALAFSHQSYQDLPLTGFKLITQLVNNIIQTQVTPELILTLCRDYHEDAAASDFLKNLYLELPILRSA